MSSAQLVSASLLADSTAVMEGAAEVTVDDPFRLRVEVQDTDAGVGPWRLEYRRPGEEWTPAAVSDFPYPAEVTPPIGILVEGTDSSAVRSGPTPEWPLVVRRFSDGGALVEDGESIELRVIDGGGAPLDGTVGLTASVPAGHLGGTFVETPGRIGPWEASNGDLYFIMEPAETDNLFMMVKSTDRGATWREVDGAGRPPVGDLEGVASVQVGSVIHILHQTSEDVWYYTFHTSDDGDAPDQWEIVDERVDETITDESLEPPTQTVAIAALPEGGVMAFYAGPTRVQMRVRAPQGGWSEEMVLDQRADPALIHSSPQAVTGHDGIVHVAWSDSRGDGWLTTLQPNGVGTLEMGVASGPTLQIASGMGTTEDERIPILPLIHHPESDVVSVIYRKADGRLMERRVTGGRELGAEELVTEGPVVTNPVDSDQVAADAIGVNGGVHLLFIEAGTGTLWQVSRGPQGSWGEASPVVEGIRGQWVRGSLLRNGAQGPIYGFVYDAGSNGGSGFNRWGEIPLGG